VIRDEPFHAHFWQCTPAEFRTCLGRPREFRHRLGIVVLFVFNDAATTERAATTP